METSQGCKTNKKTRLRIGCWERLRFHALLSCIKTDFKVLTAGPGPLISTGRSHSQRHRWICVCRWPKNGIKEVLYAIKTLMCHYVCAALPKWLHVFDMVEIISLHLYKSVLINYSVFHDTFFCFWHLWVALPRCIGFRNLEIYILSTLNDVLDD